MRFALRGRGTRHNDLRTARHRDQPVHLDLRVEPRPFG
jgi:hypothetical protein